jgi:hypothetical protein
MNKIIVRKDELLEKLKKNKEKHVGEYKEAIRGYRVKCAELLDKELQLVESGEEFTLGFNVTKPRSYEEDYIRVIEMLEMSIEDVVELDHTEFANYVMDNWAWKQSFSASNSSYRGYSGYSGYSSSHGFKEIRFGEGE